MDPFTQRMLERARARQEKIDQKLASSGQVVTKRKPLAENIETIRTNCSPVKSPSKFTKQSVPSPKKPSRESLTSNSPVKTPNRKSSLKDTKAMVSSPQRSRNDVIVTRKEYQTPKRGSINRRNSDVSVEINITHRDDIQIEVQVEERDAPINVVYELPEETGSSVIVQEIKDDHPKAIMDIDTASEQRSERSGLRHNVKSRLDRLGNLYSDNPNLSSPIHRTELEFTSATPPPTNEVKVLPQMTQPKDVKKKFGRLAALADQINNWEDDLTHHTQPSEVVKKSSKQGLKQDAMDSSTLDVSIHSIRDINKVLQSSSKTQNKPQSVSKVNSGTYTKPAVNECQRLDKKLVAELEGAGYRRVSASQSRLVYDFTTTKTTDPVRQEPKCASTTPSAVAAPKMATMVVSSPPTVTKKPSIKKYKAPTPPRKSIGDENCEGDKDKENNVVQREENDNDATESCIQTKPKPADDKTITGSPVIKRLAPKLNGNVDRNSVLSRAAMFEAGSPKAKDPAEMSLRERKALFEKNKGAAIIPKAPFGQAPSVKTLRGDTKADKSPRPVVQQIKTRRNSKETISDDNVSQTSVGGIKGKLAALFSKEQTISESSISNKNKQEREKEMEMLQNRFNYKPSQPTKPNDNDSDDENSDYPSEKAPLMGSSLSLVLNKKPEIIANVPKLLDDKTRSESTPNFDKVDKPVDNVTSSQPVKRRSSQDSPIVLSVLEDVKRIKVVANKKEPQTNGAVTQQPASLYPHLSDIETDTSHTQEEYSDCGGSSDDVSKDKLNQSDNWAETSFGRDVMNVVKKNNTSYKKAMRHSSGSDSSCQSAADSELDDMLDEALDAETTGPTPPKLNKQSTLSSTSFVFSKEFKSPQKTAATPRADKGSELVHSVSFYRRSQNSSTPSTPVRVIRHTSPEREPSLPEQSVTTVRQRIQELQQEIAKQQTVISQASQALNLCASTIEFSGSLEQAEGERLLLLATHRHKACLHELQRLQVEGAGPAAKQGTASLHIEKITIPLRREYIRQLNAEGAVGHHCVCLIKCRDRVLATSMQLTERSARHLALPDQVHMDGLTSDFKVTVEVYLLQASKEFLPHDVKYHINKKPNSKLLTPKSKVSELKSAASPGPTPLRTPQFQLHGYCIFALPQATRTSFTLNKVPGGSPVEGALQVSLRARLRVEAARAHAAWLTAFDDVRGLGAWHRRWFRLAAPNLAYWKYPDDVTHKLPMGDIDLTTVISDKIEKAPRDLCARPNTILLETTVPPGIIPDTNSLIYVQKKDGAWARRHLLAADTAADRDEWLDCLNKALEYVRCCQSDE